MLIRWYEHPDHWKESRPCLLCRSITGPSACYEEPFWGTNETKTHSRDRERTGLQFGMSVKKVNSARQKVLAKPEKKLKRIMLTAFKRMLTKKFLSTLPKSVPVGITLLERSTSIPKPNLIQIVRRRGSQNRLVLPKLKSELRNTENNMRNRGAKLKRKQALAQEVLRRRSRQESLVGNKCPNSLLFAKQLVNFVVKLGLMLVYCRKIILQKP